MKTVAIIQARMSSRRLPGKVLMDIAGAPLLARVVERAHASGAFDAVIVATSKDGSDDPVAEFCAHKGVPCFRGDLEDVLERYRSAAAAAGAEIVARITADCPLLDPAVIHAVVKAFNPASHDYVSNVLERTYPKGLDIEVLSMAALERMAKEAKTPYDREHVTTYIRTNPGFFRVHNVTQKENRAKLRWTVDEPADLAFVRAVYAKMPTTTFGQDEILALLEKHPEMHAINSSVGA